MGKTPKKSMIDGHDDLPMNGPDIQITSSFWSHLTTFLTRHPVFFKLTASRSPGFQASATTEHLQGENEYSPSDLSKEDGHLLFQVTPGEPSQPRRTWDPAKDPAFMVT